MMWRDIEEAARRLMDLFPLKAAAGVCLLSLEQHALMFLAFSLLVAMDCLSRRQTDPRRRQAGGAA